MICTLQFLFDMHRDPLVTSRSNLFVWTTEAPNAFVVDDRHHIINSDIPHEAVAHMG